MVKIPKIKKTLHHFLLESSKDILTTTVLGVSMLGNQVEAAITNSSSPALPYPAVSDGYRANNTAGPVGLTIMNGATCSHVSGIVNGHMSLVPSVNPSYTVYNLYSHGSHSSHVSHCNCSRWR